jgi:protein-S-isoprenylcysteine O-methyltransferase Ste14
MDSGNAAAGAAPGAAAELRADSLIARRQTAYPARRDLTLRISELVIFLAAVIGAIALGAGITGYFAERPYPSAYLIAYAAFRLADLLVREEASLGIDGIRFARRVINELPILAVFFGAAFEREYLYDHTIAPRWLAALGLLIELIGLWLALGARVQLGFFSPLPADGSARPLIRNGLYRYTRHPTYLGEFLVVAAWPFEYGAPITLSLTVLVGVAMMQRRIRDEEAEMLALYGDEYAVYIAATDSVIPNVW